MTSYIVVFNAYIRTLNSKKVNINYLIVFAYFHVELPKTECFGFFLNTLLSDVALRDKDNRTQVGLTTHLIISYNQMVISKLHW